MPLSAQTFFFAQAADVHVLRGDPAIDLKTLLSVAWEGDKSGSFAEYVAAHDPLDAVVEFRPTFLYPANQPVFANFGIEITRGSGILRALAGPVGEPKPHNFTSRKWPQNSKTFFEQLGAPRIMKGYGTGKGARSPRSSAAG
jgi:hypothetical protein